MTKRALEFVEMNILLLITKILWNFRVPFKPFFFLKTLLVLLVGSFCNKINAFTSSILFHYLIISCFIIFYSCQEKHQKLHLFQKLAWVIMYNSRSLFCLRNIVQSYTIHALLPSICRKKIHTIFIVFSIVQKQYFLPHKNL